MSLATVALSDNKQTSKKELTEEDVLKKEFKPSGDIDDPEIHDSKLDDEQQVRK
jgi:hypothetical protein